jgi:hypothetical protein
MNREQDGTDLAEQLADELKLQAWLAGAELKNPSLKEVTLRQEIDALVALREELRLQLHLGMLDAKDEFHRIDERWKHLVQAASSAASGAAKTLRELVAEIREGYRAMALTEAT